VLPTGTLSVTSSPEGMGVVPWGALGSGNYKTEGRSQSSEGRNLPEIPEADVAISKVLESMAKEKDTITTSIAYDLSPCHIAYYLKG
jgi:aryl-alcohol dehydrogenase-like predicted oxidoreductase